MELYWEAKEKKNYFEDFFKTILQILLEPVNYFKSIPQDNAIGSALAFGVICQTLAALFQFAYQSLFNIGFIGLGWLTNSFQEQILSSGLSFVTGGIGIVFTPIGALVNLFLYTAIYHLFLWMLGGKQFGFNSTLKVVSYAQAPLILSIIPVMGGLLAFIWQYVICIIGIKETHQTTYPRAIMAVVLPALLCCGLILLVVGGLLALIGLMIKSPAPMTM